MSLRRKLKKVDGNYEWLPQYLRSIPNKNTTSGANRGGSDTPGAVTKWHHGCAPQPSCPFSCTCLIQLPDLLLLFFRRSCKYILLCEVSLKYWLTVYKHCGAQRMYSTARWSLWLLNFGFEGRWKQILERQWHGRKETWMLVLVMLWEGGPFLGPESGLMYNTQKWIVQRDPRADKAGAFIGKECLGGEQEGERTQEDFSPMLLSLRFDG